MRIQVDEKRCEGHGFCEEQAPELFELDDEGLLPTTTTAAKSRPSSRPRARRPPVSVRSPPSRWRSEHETRRGGRRVRRRQTAARGLRLGGWDGDVVLRSEERHPADGDAIAHDALIIATGARARTLPGADDAGAHTLRTLDDALELNVALTPASSVIVVGGGPLGMEVASSSVALGCATTVVAQTPPLELQLGPYIARRLTTAAEAAGVEVVYEPAGATVIIDSGTAVRLADGRVLHADVVVVAIGCQSNLESLADSGLDLRGGLVVDTHLNAGDGIFAAGDVVAFPDGTSQARSPFWTNASEQAMTAAHNVLHPDDQHPHLARPHLS